MLIDIWDAGLSLLLLPWVWRAVFHMQIQVSAIRFTSHLQGSPQHLSESALHTDFVILVPAHNEQDSIARTLDSLKSLQYDKRHLEIMVIADNCDDETAEIARQHGVSVIERKDATRRSKGYALEFAVEHLQQRAEQPDAIMIIDADTRVDANLARVFAAYLKQGHSWIQAYYGVLNPDTSWRTRLMTLALGLFNGIWLMGQDRLGLGAALRGNGMCFRWSALQICPLKAYSLAEDLEYSWHLRLAGEKVVFAPEAKVYGEMVSKGPAAVTQRQRWEKGRKDLQEEFRQAIYQAQNLGFWKKVAFFSDLYMWPLARLVFWTMLAGTGIILNLLFIGKTSWAGLLFLFWLLVLLSFGTYILLPFLKLDLPWKYGKALLYAPLYLLWKAVLSLKKTTNHWIRTDRQENSE